MLLGADRLFRRFQKTGDPRLLGQVFDRTAGELLKVALHLTRDRHRAEDLLQSTFLTAIEKARTFDAERRVLPWLLAILANHARQAHRRERLPLPVPRAEGTDGDVADQVAARELADACDRAVDGLPEPYRHVLLLHLRHGMAGQEIAHALDRPDSTVRNQIARGLDLLRRRLPAGIASAAVLVTGGRGLAAVRAAVLARVPEGVTVAAVPLTLGVMLMSKKVLVPLVLVLAMGVGWFAGVLPIPVEAQPNAARSEQAAANTARVIEPVPAASPPAERVEVPAPRERESGTGALHAQVSVEGDGSPVGGVPFAVMSPGQIHLVRAEGITSADGTADIDNLPVGVCSFTLTGRGRDRGTFAQIQSGKVVQVKLTIPRGQRIEGTVIDGSGRPVANAEVRAYSEPLSALLCRSAADGSFAVDFMSGGCMVWALAAGRQPSRLYPVAHAGEKMRLVVGEAGELLRGRVVDEQGRPAPGAVVFLGIDQHSGLPCTERRMFDLRAGNDGTFAADWLPAGNLFVGALPADADVERCSARWVDVEAGVAANVALQLGDGPQVKGQARDEHGKPVADVSVTASLRGEAGLSPLDWRAVRTGADGTFVIPGVVPGKHELGANRGRITSSVQLQLERSQVATWNPELGEGRFLAVRVVDPDDQPMSDGFVDVRRSEESWGFEGGRTDANGRCRFEHLPAGAFVVRFLSEDGVVCAELAAVPGAPEQLLRIDAARMPRSRASGRAVDARGSVVADADVSLLGGPMVRTLRTTEGRFATSRLPPGTYWIYARSKNPALGCSRRQFTLAVKQELDLGDLVLPDAAFLSVRVQSADRRAVRGAVLRLDESEHLGVVDLAPDEVDGVYRKSAIDPGSYVLRFFASDGVPQLVPLQLGAGERRELELTVQRGVPIVVELKCADRRQTGIVNGMLTITDAANEAVLTWRLWGYYEDWAQRILRVRLALTPGNYRVTASENSERIAEFTVPSVPPAAPVVLDLR